METEKRKELLGVQPGLLSRTNPGVPVCINEGYPVGEDRLFFSGRVLTEAAVHCWGHHSFWVFLAPGMMENQVVLAFVWGLFGCVDILSQSTLAD